MSRKLDEFFEELKNNEELRFEIYKILKDYPHEKVLDEFTVEEQLKFICKVILPFARRYGFEFDLTDVVFDDIEKLEDLYLGEISGGSSLGRKMTAGTLAAISMLTFVPSAVTFAKGTDAQSVVTLSEKESKKDEADYGNILDILKNGAQKLHPISKNYPINEVDGLILSTVSYLPMDFVPDLNLDSHQDAITVEQWADRLFKYEETKNEDLMFHKKDIHTLKRYIKFDKNKASDPMDEERKRLLKLIAASPRYKDIKIGDFSGEYVEYSVGQKDTVQFAAVTFTLQDGTKIVTFRGTDGTMSGWKEDLDLSWSKKVIAQEYALRYLKDIFNLNPKSDFFVVGHSKGGNLALYSAFYLCNESESFRNSLTNIFNYDGPGLNKDIVKDIDPTLFDAISKKLVTYIPQSSLIGRIMDYTSKGELRCVNSTVQEASDILLQHEPLTWNISPDYECKDAFNKFESNVVQPESKFMADATALFVETVDRENSMRVFVQWVFDFMVKNNIKIDDSRSMNQICRDLFYNYFVKNKSIYDMVNVVFAPSTAIYLSESEQQSFKNILHTTFSSLLKAYWGLHIELNKKMGLSPKITKALEELINNNYALSDIYNVAKVIKEDAVTWKNTKSFLKKLYGI